MIHAEIIVTRPPDAVRILASSTVFWNASNVRKRLLPMGELWCSEAEERKETRFRDGQLIS
jgi:hypothetical protein